MGDFNIWLNLEYCDTTGSGESGSASSCGSAAKILLSTLLSSTVLLLLLSRGRSSLADKVPLELDDSTTKVAREADGTGDGVILDTDVSNDKAGDGVVEEDEATGLGAVASVVATDVIEDCVGIGASSVIAVVEEDEEDDDEESGAVEASGVMDFSAFRTSLLGDVTVLAAGTAGRVRVMLALPLATMAGGEVAMGCLEATISGLESGALPDLLRLRCRSDDECRVSVDSSCRARFRFDFLLADLSRSPSVPLLLLTGLSPPMSFSRPTRGFLIPDFMVEVRILGDGGDSRLLP